VARRPSIPIACTLSTSDAAAQAAEWVALRADLVDHSEVPRGRRLCFPIAMADRVRDLARREATCCAFLDIVVSEDERHVRVTITSDDPAAAPVIGLLCGDPI